MRAVGIHEFGGPEVLELVDLDVPLPAVGEVRVRVHAATVNPTDTQLRSGFYAAMVRDLPAPWVPGMDVAGVVDVTGDEVADWEPGDEVMAMVLPARPGAYAEYVVVPAASLARQPAGAGHAAAATLPMNGLTAVRTLDLLDLAPGSWLAVTGAAGALGGYLVQLASHAGIRVVADASPADEATVRALGAEVVVARGDDVAQRIRAAVPNGVEALADAAVLDDLAVPAVRDGGQLAVFRRWKGDLGRGITRHTVSVTDYLTDAPRLDRLRELVEAGVVTLRVADVVPAANAAQAHRRLEAGGIRGRLVLEF